MTTDHHALLLNANAQPRIPISDSPANLAADFHKQLPGYNHTPLINLDDVAKELGVQSVRLKDESTRLGLPSFKILGASWGVVKALTQTLGLPANTGIEDLKRAVASHLISLHAATDGNHGRAVARMGSIFSVPVEIWVPASMRAGTIDLIRSEGAEVVVSSGSYDDAVLEAQRSAERKGGILIQDFAFGDYVDIPRWIVDGYATMMLEIDEQMGEDIDLVVVPVGVGSFAQAVVSHYKGKKSPPRILTVEPETAACLYKNLRAGEMVVERTSPTIMEGLDCGTVSSIAWHTLRDGLDAALTVSDYEAHQASVYLKILGISSGPCGAATLAALRLLNESDKVALGLSASSSILLLSTEGFRDYTVPLRIDSDGATTSA